MRRPELPGRTAGPGGTGSRYAAAAARRSALGESRPTARDEPVTADEYADGMGQRFGGPLLGRAGGRRVVREPVAGRRFLEHQPIAANRRRVDALEPEEADV